MQITVVLKQKLETLPPVMNLIDCLIDFNLSINLVCTDIEAPNFERYTPRVNITIIKFTEFKFRPFKVFSLISFRKNVHKYFKTNKLGLSKDSIIWLASAEAALGVGRKISNYNFVFQCHELYDKVPQYRLQNKFYFQNSMINICPESNRAAIFRYWYSLKETPSILVNAPYFHPKQKCMKISNAKNEKEIFKLKGKKIILYMGQVSAERDITAFVRAIDELDNDFHLVVMGAYIPDQDYVKSLKDNFKKITFISGMPSPTHFEVASWAYVGILSYTFIDLNNIFCAPNKVWEYSGFGIPMISNDVPGIASLLEKYNSGIAVNTNSKNIESIKDALHEIDRNHDVYSSNSFKMFSVANYRLQLESILNKLSK